MERRQPSRAAFRTLPLLILLVCSMGAGCATLGVRDPSLELQIVPQPVERGKYAMAKINAPLDAEKVIGTVKTFGSPQLLFRKDKEKGLWYFYGIIPFSPWVKPGRYTVQVMAFQPPSQPRYTEMEVELK